MCGSRGGIGGLDPPGKSQVLWVSIELAFSPPPPGKSLTPVFLLLMRVDRIKILLKVGHHWPASETPFKWRLAGWPMMAKH